MARFRFAVGKDPLDPAIAPQQIAAAVEPELPTRELLGNFGDFAALLRQVEEPAVIELGKPLLKPRFMPRRRLGDCPAAHNEALLSDDD